MNAKRLRFEASRCARGKAFRVRLLADELFVFTSLVPEWSSPTSGVANAAHLSVSSISSKCFSYGVIPYLVVSLKS